MAISLRSNSKLSNLLALNLQSILDAPIIELDSIDSTNNYAMGLIDADTAQPGLTVVTAQQTQGKGQRGRRWEDIPGQSVLMSIIITPEFGLDQQFTFNAVIACAIADTLTDLYESWNVQIKWPNDIIINDKKAGGILIENVLRGSNWAYSVLGFGLNVLQNNFPLELPYATSLKIQSGINFNITDLYKKLRRKILTKVYSAPDAMTVIKSYNELLFRKGEVQRFTSSGHEWNARIVEALPNGQLMLQLEDNSITTYSHGSVTWVWQ